MMNKTDNWIDNSEKYKEDIKKILLNMKENFWKNRNNNEKILQEYLKNNFWIENIRRDWMEIIYFKVLNDLNNFKFFEKEKILDYDISDFEHEIEKLQKRSEILKNFKKEKLDKTENEIKETIKNYLELNLSTENEKEIFKKIKNYVWEIENVKQINFKQTLLQVMWEKSLLLSLVVEINWKKVDIDILKNKKTGEIKKDFITKADYDLMWKPLKWGEKKSTIIKKLYDNPNAWVEINDEYKLDKTKFNLENDEVTSYKNNRWEIKKQVNFDNSIREQVKNWEKDEELNIFIQVTKEWNKIFKVNKDELNKITDKTKRKEIISNNAQKIANLFADNATLQWTVNFDNSIWFKWIKEYFEHFLPLSPTMWFSKINDIDREEDWLLVVQWDYDFEVEDWEWWRKSLDANFDFYLEKNQKTGKWGIKRLKSTFWKTENNLKED